MQSWTFILVLLLTGLGYIFWPAYGRMLLNKVVRIRKINPATLGSVGDLKLTGDIIEIKFRWNTKSFYLHQIQQIKAYALTDWGLQEYEQVDILFDTTDKIIFDGSIQEHRDFIQSNATMFGIHSKIWSWGDLPHLGDNMGRDLIFEKNRSR